MTANSSNEWQGNGSFEELRYAKAMSRFSIALPTLLIASVSFGVSVASASPRSDGARTELQATTATTAADENTTPQVKARYAGIIDGVVSAVDYRSGTMSVQMPNRRIDIVVLPSTTIQSTTNAFHTIADIVKGQRVQVFMSQRGNSYVAEIIHLR
jgi:hypothetical protein